MDWGALLCDLHKFAFTPSRNARTALGNVALMSPAALPHQTEQNGYLHLQHDQVQSALG
jgi:hypothetical protein